MAGFTFQKASKTRRKAKIGLIGPTGSGKTMTALRIATGIAGEGGRIGLIDTENESASLYADQFEFDSLNLESFSPEVYVQAIKAAEAEGFDVLIIDSLSHAWMGKDGALEQVDKAARRYQGNSYAAWRDVTPKHNDLVEALVRCKCHLIVTMRAKTEYVVEKDEKTGKTFPKKVGLAPIQRDGLEYEFDIVGDLDHENNLVITKTRYSALTGEVIHQPGEDLGQRIKAWLEDGAPEKERPKQAPQQPAGGSPPQRNGAASNGANADAPDEDKRDQYLAESLAVLSSDDFGAMSNREFAAFIQHRTGANPKEADIAKIHALWLVCKAAKNGNEKAADKLEEALEAYRQAEQSDSKPDSVPTDSEVEAANAAAQEAML